jgi:cell cycle checkpoint protein
MQGQILNERFDCSSSCGSCNFSDIVTEFRPLERWIGPRNNGPISSSLHHDVGGSLVDKLNADGSNYEVEDDDVIEEC